MTENRSCLKCGGTEFVKIAGMCLQGRSVPFGAFGVAKLDRYMCASCGFIDTYIAPEHIRKVTEHFGTIKKPQNEMQER